VLTRLVLDVTVSLVQEATFPEGVIHLLLEPRILP